MTRRGRAAGLGDLQEAIKETAWRQVAEFGAAALSLRAIARELGITAPAIYNYFARRDDLITALIIDAYSSLGDSQLAARDALPPEDLVGRMMATGLAYRQWALAHPQHYQLIFGTPLPDYAAPEERVFPAGARSLRALVSVMEALRLSGRLLTPGFPLPALPDAAAFDKWKKFGGETDVLSLSVAVLIWSQVHGLVSLEIAGSLPPFGLSGEQLYQLELDLICRQFIRDA